MRTRPDEYFVRACFLLEATVRGKRRKNFLRNGDKKWTNGVKAALNCKRFDNN